MGFCPCNYALQIECDAMPTARLRTDKVQSQGGSASFKTWGDPVYLYEDPDSSPYVEERICRDVVGNRDGNNPLYLYKRTVDGGLVSGFEDLGYGWFYKSSNWPIPFRGATFPWRSKLNSENSDTARLLAVTNPSRPDIMAPVSFIELKDLPGMLKHAGSVLNGSALKRGYRSGISAAKEAASANLAIKFGWQPLVSDLRTMLGLTASVEARKKELQRLYSGKGLKRRLKLATHSDFWIEPNVTVMSDYVTGSYTTDVSFHQELRRWGTVRWKPGSKPLPLDPEINRIVTGHTLASAGVQAWELIPWSWLSDYFSNLGDVLSLSNNHLGATFHDLCLMTQSEGKIIVPGGVTGRGFAVTRMVSTTSIKVRTLGSPPTFEAELPILTGSQMSILASIGILRAKPPRG